MLTIFSKILFEMEHQRDTCLVVVTESSGSVPRGSGACMLVGRNGRLLGSVGGGAIEKKAVEIAIAVLDEGCSFSRKYSLQSGDAKGLDMVCGGTVTLIFSYMEWDNNFSRTLSQALKEHIVKGEKLWLLFRDGSLNSLYNSSGYVAGLHFPVGYIPKLSGNNPIHLSEQEIIAIPVSCGERLIIFGAGHIARALSPLAMTVGFRPVIYDDRPEYASERLFPGAEQVICASYEDIAAHIELSAEDYVVIMTSGHSHDLTVQRQVMDSGAYAYLGVIGSRAKTAVLNKALLEHGISQEALDKVHTPIGTAIRAVTPEEIAVSIAGELILVRADGRGGK